MSDIVSIYSNNLAIKKCESREMMEDDKTYDKLQISYHWMCFMWPANARKNDAKMLGQIVYCYA